MLEKTSRSAHLYKAIKAEMRSGAYPPGYPISAATLSRRFSTSIIPVREALNRLTGERLVEVRDQNGFFAPRINENGLRDLYRAQVGLLQCALEQPISPYRSDHTAFDPAAHGSVWVALERLFTMLADTTASAELHWLLRNTLDRLHPVYRLKQEIVVGWESQCTWLLDQWRSGDITGFRDALTVYHERRLDLVPLLVERMNEPRIEH